MADNSRHDDAPLPGPQFARGIPAREFHADGPAPRRQHFDRPSGPAAAPRSSDDGHTSGPRVTSPGDSFKLKLGHAVGQGSFAVVHKALLDARLVAVKVLRPEYSNHKIVVRMLLKEAHIMTCLDHPHIVRCQTLCQVPAGPNRATYALVMEYMECGSSIYMSPEVAQEQPYNEKADVFSFGVMVFEVVSRTLIAQTTAGQDGAGFTRMLVEGRRPALPPSLDPRVSALIASCWQADPVERPTMAQVVWELRDVLALDPRPSPHATSASAAAAAPYPPSPFSSAALQQHPHHGPGAPGHRRPSEPSGQASSCAFSASPSRNTSRTTPPTGTQPSLLSTTYTTGGGGGGAAVRTASGSEYESGQWPGGGGGGGAAPPRSSRLPPTAADRRVRGGGGGGAAAAPPPPQPVALGAAAATTQRVGAAAAPQPRTVKEPRGGIATAAAAAAAASAPTSTEL
ncbi:putative inactive serine/threonine-protein kinase roco10 [Tetrabaena socialis]|uniref:Putative inactive serine/threonine-protein kinase roco10 n=1 Tax=Tetrabaena socialis TaxID=47790 RepID=A0A2J7ZJS8_9CHLO|nr:putative inactive serine/threonine-protein kinase roco10 [Tetrabaena socialis]|eukprot:PNH00521.1 putative inactive serine/threonine-protein kinase roco10 [Tetrabaena socialis]